MVGKLVSTRLILAYGILHRRLQAENVARSCICYGISVCPSICPSHCGIVSKRGNAEGCGLYRRVAQCLQFPDAKMVDGDDTVQVKFERKEVDPCENSRAVHISPHNSGIIIDNEKSSFNAKRKLTTVVLSVNW